MTDKKGLKFKTLDDIKNDVIYEINLFSKKRRTQSKLNTPTAKISDEDNVEDQVRK